MTSSSSPWSVCWISSGGMYGMNSEVPSRITRAGPVGRAGHNRSQLAAAPGQAQSRRIGVGEGDVLDRCRPASSMSTVQ